MNYFYIFYLITVLAGPALGPDAHVVHRAMRTFLPEIPSPQKLKRLVLNTLHAEKQFPKRSVDMLV